MSFIGDAFKCVVGVGAGVCTGNPLVGVAAFQAADALTEDDEAAKKAKSDSASQYALNAAMSQYIG